MLSRLIHAGLCNGLALMAIAFIAVGMPLVHPALHDDLDHRGHDTAHCGAQVPATQDEGHAHECPLCDFLATSQWLTAAGPPLIALDGPIGNNLSGYPLFIGIAPSIPLQPRAPPVSNPFPEA